MAANPRDHSKRNRRPPGLSVSGVWAFEIGFRPIRSAVDARDFAYHGTVLVANLSHSREEKANADGSRRSFN